MDSLALHGHDLRFTYPGVDAPALRDVAVSVRPGRLVAVAGPNGSGKTTLLRVLSGALTPRSGTVTLGPGSDDRGTDDDGPRPLGHLDDRERARAIAVVTQSEWSPFPVTVRELVAMGRYPHLRPWAAQSERDRAVVKDAMERCAVSTLAGRSARELSGGERQRARLARALAQEAPVLLLDEPTAGLDLRYRMEFFRLLDQLRGDGLAVLIVTHDLNLAARFADRILLLDRGRSRAFGPPAEVLTRDVLEVVYEWPVLVVPHQGPGSDRGAPQTVPLRSRGH